MDAYQAIIGKRDRRDYDSKALPDEVQHRILQAGRMAGTSSNSQHARIIVLNDRPALEALVPAGRGTAPMLKSPFSVAIVSSTANSFDVGRIAQNMMVAAWADGVISCPQGIQDQDLARKALGLPDEYTVGMCLAFGYPEPNGAKGESRPRISMEETVHWGRW